MDLIKPLYFKSTKINQNHDLYIHYINKYYVMTIYLKYSDGFLMMFSAGICEVHSQCMLNEEILQNGWQLMIRMEVMRVIPR